MVYIYVGQVLFCNNFSPHIYSQRKTSYINLSTGLSTLSTIQKLSCPQHCA